MSYIVPTPEIDTNLAIYIKWVPGKQHTYFLLVCLLHSHHIVEVSIILKERLITQNHVTYPEYIKYILRYGPYPRHYLSVLEYISKVSKEYNIHFFSPEDRTDFGGGSVTK